MSFPLDYKWSFLLSTHLSNYILRCLFTLLNFPIKHGWFDFLKLSRYFLIGSVFYFLLIIVTAFAWLFLYYVMFNWLFTWSIRFMAENSSFLPLCLWGAVLGISCSNSLFLSFSSLWIFANKIVFSSSWAFRIHSLSSLTFLISDINSLTTPFGSYLLS